MCLENQRIGHWCWKTPPWPSWGSNINLSIIKHEPQKIQTSDKMGSRLQSAHNFMFINYIKGKIRDGCLNTCKFLKFLSRLLYGLLTYSLFPPVSCLNPSCIEHPLCTQSAFSPLIIMAVPALLVCMPTAATLCSFLLPVLTEPFPTSGPLHLLFPWPWVLLLMCIYQAVSATITSLERLPLTNPVSASPSNCGIFSCWWVLADKDSLEPVMLMAKIHSHIWCLP